MCPACSGIKVCVVVGGSATCECPSGYVDDGSGGCMLVPGMFTFLKKKLNLIVSYFDVF